MYKLCTYVHNILTSSKLHVCFIRGFLVGNVNLIFKKLKMKEIKMFKYIFKVVHKSQVPIAVALW